MHRPNIRWSDMNREPLPYPVDLWVPWVLVAVLATFSLMLAFGVPPNEPKPEDATVNAQR